MNSIVEALAEHARHEPERLALLFEGRTFSYARLWADVDRFARALASSGIASGERVALFLENCPEFVVAYLGAQRAGAVVVPINTQYRQIELSHILADAGVRLCVTSPAGAAELARLPLPDLRMLVIVGVAGENGEQGEQGEQGAPSSGDATCIPFNAFIVRGGGQAGQALPLPAPDAPAVIGYTSGTTGRSKGALLLHRNLAANAAAVTSAWRWTRDDRLLLTLPLFHTHGLMVGLHGTLLTGASAVLRRRFDAADVLTMLRDDPVITLFFGVPTMYGRLLAETERQGTAALPAHLPRLFVSGSAPLSPRVFADFERLFGRRILERYGMTETIMNLTNPHDGERRPGTVGGPFPGQQARVVDVRTRDPLPPGVIGEIEVRGPHVFAGYWNRPDATAEAFGPDGWFKTGDLGSVSDDGYFTITGRARELIISGGYNVYPREVEEALAGHPAVAEVAVVGAPDPDLGEQVVAVIVSKDGARPSADEIAAYCRERLASYKKPRRVVFVDALPRNALGKVQKHLLAGTVMQP